MAAVVMDPSRAPVAFGLRAVPQLFEELQQPDTGRRRRALATLCDLMHEPERLHQTVSGGQRSRGVGATSCLPVSIKQDVPFCAAGFLEQLKAPLQDEDASVRAQTCELLQLLAQHHSGR